MHRHADELRRETEDRIGNVDDAAIVVVGRVLAGRREGPQELEIQVEDRIGDIHD